MRGRFYFADGRLAEDVNLDVRAVRHALVDGGRLRWFRPTGDVDPDGFVVLREVSPPRAGDSPKT